MTPKTARPPPVAAGRLRRLAAAPAGAETYGPYNADPAARRRRPGRPLAGKPLPAQGPWSLQGWVSPTTVSTGRVVVAGAGDPAAGGRFIVLDDGAPAVATGSATLKGPGALKPGGWSHLAAVSDGTRVALYVDGAKVAEGVAGPVASAATVQLGAAQARRTISAEKSPVSPPRPRP